MKRASVTLFAILVLASAAACAKAKRPALQPSAPVPGAILWTEPADLASRDLFYGPWGAENAPNPADTYRLLETKRTGVNLGYTVKDSQDREWSVKTPYPGGLDSEAPVEVAVSRLLSAVGYPQPPVYFLPAFRLKDDLGTRTMVGGRFRLKDKTLKDEGAWAWDENPFINSKPYQGLLVILTMLNSTDMKNSNNTLYQRQNGDLVEQWYVVRDVGAALGDFDRFTPRKNNIAAFEKAAYINGVENGHVQFAYKGWYTPFIEDRISPADVVWASNLLGRLSDKQWNDAFRAAGYEPAEASRFIAKIKQKVKDGRSLGTAVASRDQER
jgi:hypothetical protein